MKKYLLGLYFIAIDIFLLSAIFYITLFIRKSVHIAYFSLFTGSMLKDFLFIIIIILTLLYHEKIYFQRYDFWQETKQILKALILAYSIVLSLLTLLKISSEYSRSFISLYFLLTLFFLPIGKRFAKRLIYKFSYFKNKVLIIGDRVEKDILKKEFISNWFIGMQCEEEGFDTVIIFSKGIDVDELNKKIATYLMTKNTVYIVPYVNNINFSNSEILEYSNIRYNTIQIENKLLIKRNIWIKNILDFILIMLLLPFFIVIHVVLVILIKVDSKGDILFKQKRLGKNNSSFICYKYRTMYENSDELLHKYLLEQPNEKDYYEKYHKYNNDPRITKIGKLLRATSLDELAQIVNIIKGEMSFVGPRPYMLCESKQLGDSQDSILKVKPGITGLWQVSGRNSLTFKERKELEIWYIINWSLWADLIIFLKTIKVVLLKIGVNENS
jgi:undecaprenyl-phosphate galactose phosphotransferase